MTVMAMRALDREPDVLDVVEALSELMDRWPVGQPVRHQAGWTGRIVEDGPPEFPAYAHSAGHAVVAISVYVVAVEWRVDGCRAVAWYAPHVLRRLGGGAR